MSLNKGDKEDQKNPIAKVEVQEAMCRRLALANDIEVVAVYVDDGVGAFTFKNRPGWKEMLNDVEAGKVDVLLAQAEDRFTRQPMEKEILALTCAAAGVTFLTVNDGSVDPVGWEEDRLTLRTSEADLIREAYADLVYKARTPSAIATAWNKAGIPTTRGSRWDIPKVTAV